MLFIDAVLSKQQQVVHTYHVFDCAGGGKILLIWYAACCRRREHKLEATIISL